MAMKTMVAFSRHISGWFAACIMAAPLLLGAQSVAPRVTQAVDDTSRVALKGNVPMLIRSASDQGAVDASTSFTHVRLVLQRSTEQESALKQYLSELQQKSSPNYHKWLTPEQFGKLYGPTDSDIAAITAWLESEGLTVVSVSKGRTNIEFSGTASQLQQAFQTSIHSYLLNGRQFYSNTSEPTIPSALSSVVSGVAHLNTHTPRPLYHTGKTGQIEKATGRLIPVTSSTSTDKLRAQLSYENSYGDYYLYVVPGDAATIYNTPNSTLNANYTSGTTYTGSGVTIGIGGDAAISTSPIVNYRSTFLSPYAATAPTITYVGNVTSTTDADEAYIDTELSAGLAPGATIHYYASSDLDSAIEQALTDNTVDIFSLSFGECELDLTTADNKQIYGWWEQAAIQGIAVTVSTGDSGSAGCDATTDSNNNSVTVASSGLAVNGLASTPYNIAVGGTDYYSLESNFSTYATVPSSASSSAGSSSTYYRTAKKYIPESTWNDSSYSNTTISANIPWTAISNYSSYANIVGGGGGKSSCSTNTTSSSTGSCNSGYAKPSWQRGTGVPDDSARDLPDISLLAADGMDYVTWLVCTEDTYQGKTENCDSNGYFAGYGGTSTSAPAFAGILALVQESQGGGRLGQAAANLYNLYNNSSYASSIFHDVEVGNISVPCTSGTTDCDKNSAGYYFESGYDTTSGYDLATGLGSVDAAKLVKYWDTSMGSATATVTVTPADSTINIANSLSVGVDVTGSSSTPSGSVTLSSGSYTSSVVNLNNEEATITIPANSLSVGTNTLTVTYSGDGIYSSATGTASVTVDSATLTTTTTSLAASSTAATYGTSITLTATVSPTAASGTVTFYDGTTTLGTGTLSSGTATYTTSALSVGTHTITATYAGNTTYASSTSSSVTVTVSSSSSSGTGTSSSTTITITPAGGYTGTVTFSASTTSTTLSSSTSVCYIVSDASVTGTAAVTQTLTFEAAASCATSEARKGAANIRLGNASTLNKISANSAPPVMRAAFGLIGFVFAALLGWRWRKLRVLASLIVLVVLGFALSGCGGGSKSGTSTTKSFSLSVSPSTVTISAGNSGAPTGTYALTLTGTDSSSSSITSSTTVTLVID
jgi:trimeric autotransporter adhesin